MKFGGFKRLRRVGVTAGLTVTFVGLLVGISFAALAKPHRRVAARVIEHAAEAKGHASKAHKAKATAKTKHHAKAKAIASAGTDYELSGANHALASFLLTTTTHGATTTEAIKDLVVQAPISYQNAPTPQIPVDVELLSAPILVKNGTFSTGAITRGNGTVLSGTVSSTAVTLDYRHESNQWNAYDDATYTGDTGQLTLKGKPASRLSITNGVWSGTDDRSQPVQLRIAAGGRVLEPDNVESPTDGLWGSIAFGAFTYGNGTAYAGPTTTDDCGYSDPYPEFIDADGTVSNAAWNDGAGYESEGDGDDPYFTGQFTSARSIKGTFNNGGEACLQINWSAHP